LEENQRANDHTAAQSCNREVPPTMRFKTLAKLWVAFQQCDRLNPAVEVYEQIFGGGTGKIK